jgi:phage gp29-like protein
MKIPFLSNDNKKISQKDLTEQQAHAVANSNRSLWGGGLVRGLTPQKLAGILDAARGGETPAEYLEIAQELEQRDAHYRSVLSTRKHALEGLSMYVEASGDAAKEKEISEAVEKDILNHPDILDLRKNSLDALGKGFSVNEIIWDTEGKRWKPKTFLFRDPRWFAYEKETGRLCLRPPSGQELAPLAEYRFIVHEPNLLSGMQITSGLSFTALFYWLIKNYDLTSWAAFVDRFGYPVRLGKYGKKATKEDIATLKRAVAAIGSDVGAVIPDSMIIDIIESKTTGTNAQVYQSLAEWVDKQLSKLVLGQTASSEGQPGALGGPGGQEEVRQDIIRADAAQFDQTINRDLVIPYINLNFGPREIYPKIVTQIVETKNVTLIVDAIQKLVPLGLKVSKTEVLGLLGLASPSDDDEVLEAPAFGGGMLPQLNAQKKETLSLNAEETPEEEESSEYENDFVEITDEIVEVLQNAADKATDLKSIEEEIKKLVTDWPPDKIARTIAIATFKKRIDGNLEFDT